MKLSLRLLFELVFAFVFLAGLGVGLLLWRLNEGDIQLHALLPDIEEVLDDAAPGLKFDIKSAIVQQGDDDDLFSVKVADIRITNSSDQVVGNLQEMQLGFSWRNFAHLSFIPAKVEIQHPTLELTRTENGHIGFNLSPETHPAGSSRSVPELAYMLAHAPGVLKQITVNDAWIGFDDQKQKLKYEGQNGLFVIKRENGQVTGTLSLNIKGKDINQPIRGTIDFDPKRDVTRFRTAITGLYLNQLSPFLPQIPDALKVDMPMDVLVRLSIDHDYQPVAVDLRLMAKKGSVTYDPYLKAPIQISDVSAYLSYDMAKNHLILRNLGMKLGKAVLRAHAEMATDGLDASSAKHVTLTALLEGMPLDDLDKYWPEGVPGPKAWIVQHLHDGIAEQAGLDLSADLTPDNKLAVKDLGGKITFKDVTVDYLPPMPQVKKVSGSATYDQDNFYITLNEGILFDTKIDTADLHIKDLTKDLQNIDIDINMHGPIVDAIRTIESKPLQYPQRLGLTSSQFSGDTSTKLHLSFPLLNDLKLDQVAMTTEAELQNVTIRNVVKDLTISSQKLSFKADTDKLDVEGKAKFADADNDFSWHEDFTDNGQFTTVIHTKGDVTPAVLKGLRIPVDRYIKGAAKAEADITEDHKKTTRVDVSADVGPAELAIPELNVTKKADVPGKLNLKLEAEKNGPTTLSQVNASWPDFAIKDGSARWDSNLDLASASFKGVKSGRTTADFAVAPLANNGMAVAIAGDTVDLSGYWTKKADATENRADNRRIDINVRAKKLYLDPNVPFQNVNAALSLQGPDLLSGQLTGQVDKDGTLNLQQTQAKNGQRQLLITAKNAGKVLQALDITDKVSNGTLEVKGISTPKDPAAISGEIVMKDFVIARAPVLARLINAFSPGGLIELLNGQGLAFSKMRSRFELEKPQTIRLIDGRMSGTSIGLNFGGRIYRDKKTLALSGTIIPMEGLNKFVSVIPLIGRILTGIKGEGLIGATYKITGPSDNPDVFVNPLSVLTPGILRSILFEDNN